MSSYNKYKYEAFTGLSIVTIAILYYIYNNSIYYWYYDGGVYLQIARNIQEGQSIDHNIGWMFPPGYGVMLWLWQGITSNMISDTKLINIPILMVFSAGAYQLSKGFVPKPVACLIAIACMINPAIASWRSYITTDFTFGAITVWASYYWQRLYSAPNSTKKVYVWGFSASILTCLAILVRFTGIVYSLAAIAMLAILTLKIKKEGKIYRHIILVLFSTIILSSLAYLYDTHLNSGFSSATTNNIVDKFNNFGLSGVLDYVGERIFLEHYFTVLIMFHFPYFGIQIIDRLIGTSIYNDYFSMTIYISIIIYSLSRVLRLKSYIDFVFLPYLSMIAIVPWTGQHRYYVPILYILMIYLFDIIRISIDFLRSRMFPNRWHILAQAIPTGLFGLLVAGYLALLNRVTYNEPPPDQSYFTYIDWIRNNTNNTDIVCEFLGAEFTYFSRRTSCHINEDYIRFSLNHNIEDIYKRDMADFYVLPKDHGEFYDQVLMKFRSSDIFDLAYEGKSFVIFRTVNPPTPE